MNTQNLASVLRNMSAEIRERIDSDDLVLDAAELVLVLARIIEGKSIAQAFGAPGDWGYSTPIGAALAGKGVPCG